jgi:diguanylate cyclase
MSPENIEGSLTPEQQELADLRTENAELKTKIAELEKQAELALIDPDLEIYNKRGMMRMAEVLLPRDEATGPAEKDLAAAERPPIAVAMFDLDDFRKFNTDYGHLKADEVLKEAAAMLKEAAQVLKASVRGGDVVARFGGEEFVAIFQNTTAEAINEAFMDKKTGRLRIGLTSLINGKEVRVSFSGGVTQVKMGETFKDFKEILERADQAMREAKKRGKDQIIYSADQAS